MSWKDRLENITFSIQTGDGKIYYPLWRNAEKSKDFNVSASISINREGTFVNRKKSQGNKFPLTFYFQGEDNIEQCDAFETSANDSRMWTIEHPFYGTIKGQPVNLKRNDSNYNATELTVDFWESIEEEYPVSSVSIPDETRAKVETINSLSIIQIEENSNPVIGDIINFKDIVILSSSAQTPDKESYNDYVNASKSAIKTSDNLLTDTQSALNNAQKIISKVSAFSTPSGSRISGLLSSYDILKKSVKSLFDKYFFESQGSSIIAEICLSAVTPLTGDYIVRSDIELVNKIITDVYNDYLKTLDDHQVSIYDVKNNWSSNSFIQSSLKSIVNSTSSNLFKISFDVRQERQIELTEDSNLIILTHRFIGLDADDKNIEDFREINNIKNQELYKVPKGRLIKYFV